MPDVATPGGFPAEGDPGGSRYRARPSRAGRAGRVLLAVLSTAVLALSVGGYLVTNYFDHTIARLHLNLGGSTPAADSSSNWLLVGTDSRAGSGSQYGSVPGQRSDTTILAHLAKDGTTTLVSIPRDTYVEVPAYDANGVHHLAAKDKFTNAINVGGPSLLVATVEQLTGLPVEHYVSVDLAGFKQVTDAVGGVNVCLKQSSFSSNDSGKAVHRVLAIQGQEAFIEGHLEASGCWAAPRWTRSAMTTSRARCRGCCSAGAAPSPPGGWRSGRTTRLRHLLLPARHLAIDVTDTAGQAAPATPDGAVRVAVLGLARAGPGLRGPPRRWSPETLRKERRHSESSLGPSRPGCHGCGQRHLSQSLLNLRVTQPRTDCSRTTRRAISSTFASVNPPSCCSCTARVSRRRTNAEVGICSSVACLRSCASRSLVMRRFSGTSSAAFLSAISASAASASSSAYCSRRALTSVSMRLLWSVSVMVCSALRTRAGRCRWSSTL